MYLVSIELKKHEWKFGRTINAVGIRATDECFHSFFEFSLTFTNFFTNFLPNFYYKLDRNTEYTFSISFEKHRDEKKENKLLTVTIKV